MAAIGLRDGELGLTHTRGAAAEAHLRLELSGGRMRASGSGALSNISFRRPEVSAREVRGLKLGFRANGEAALDGSHVHLADSEVSVGEVKLAGTLDLERDETGTRVRAAGGVPLAACDAVLTSIPAALLADAPGIKLEGDFRARSRAQLRLGAPERARAHVARGQRLPRHRCAGRAVAGTLSFRLGARGEGAGRRADDDSYGAEAPKD